MDVSVSETVPVRVGIVLSQKSDGQDKKQLIIDEEANKVNLRADGEQEHSYFFDVVTNQKTAQETLFSELLHPLCGLISSGYHGSLLMSGNLRSGKEEIMQDMSFIRKLLSSLFNEIAKITDGETFITVSYVQFYPDESAVDLLNPERRPLTLVAHPVLGLLVEGQCEISVAHPEEVLTLYEEGRKTLKTNAGTLGGRCSSLFSLTMEHKRQVQGAPELQHCRSKLHLFDLAGGAHKGDLNGVSPLLKFLENIESHKTADEEKLLHSLLMETLTGSYFNILVYFIQPQEYLDEETSHALALAHRIRALVTHVTLQCWYPQESVKRMRDSIQEQRTRMISQAENEEVEIRKLEKLILDLQLLKDHDWEKRKNLSDEVVEKRKKHFMGRNLQIDPSSQITNQQEAAERLTHLQDQLRQEMEAHLREGKVKVEVNQERIRQIRCLREAIAKAESKLLTATGVTNQSESSGDQDDLEYNKALNKRKMLEEEHRVMIQEEVEKLEKELGEKTQDSDVEFLRLGRERQILILQLEALRREKQQTERELEVQHCRHIQQLKTLREESLMVSEEHMEMLEDRYQSLLLEAIQDAVYLSAQNQQLQVENKELNRAVAQLKDTLSAGATRCPGDKQKPPAGSGGDRER